MKIKSAGTIVENSSGMRRDPLIHRLHTLLQFRKHEHIQQVIYILHHLTRLHEMVVQFIFRRVRCILDLPAFQQVQIIAQHPLAVHLVIPEGPRKRVRFVQCYRCRGLVRVDADVIGQFLCGLVAAQTEQPCHKINHIAGGPATKAVEVTLVQLHAGVPVIVEGAADHIAPVDFAAVVLGGLLYSDRVFHSFK